MTTIDADDLVTVKEISMSSKVTSELDKITPGSEILLYLQVESHFPQGKLKFVCFFISKCNFSRKFKIIFNVYKVFAFLANKYIL